MKWALIFWMANPGNYTVHSVYLSQEHCQEKQAYYAEKKAANILRSKAIAAADLSPVADVLASYGH